MPLSTDQLRQLLTERSEPARYRPVPQDRIRAGIRRARIRRTAAAGLAAIIVVAGILGVTGALHQHSPDQGIAGGQQFPASFTASDGAVYTRVAITSLTVPAHKSATIKLQVGQDPVDVMAACDGGQRSDAVAAGVAIAVNGADSGGFTCLPGSQLIGLSVRPNGQADITFTKATISGIRNVGASWRFAVYEWKPPAIARPAPPAPQLPQSYIGNNTATGRGKTQLRKIASASGDWPSDRTVRFTLPAPGHNLDISAVCAGAIAGRLLITMQFDGKPATVPCAPWTAGEQPPGNFGLSEYDGKPVTLTFRIEAPSPATAAAYAKRAASWTIAIYEEEP